MPPIFHNRIGCFLLLAAPLWTLSCGKSRRSTEPPETPPLAGRIASPPLVSAVALGSRDVVAEPTIGPTVGTVLMRLLTEPGAKVFYAFHEIEQTTPESELITYQAPTELLPPVAVWAVAEQNGERGPVRDFAWTLAPEAHAVEATVAVKRLAGDGSTPVALPVTTTVESFAARGVDERMDFAVQIDGDASEWPQSGRLWAADATYDVPPNRGYLDLSAAAIGEDADAFYAALFLREAPRSDATVIYGFEIGPSGIGLTSFGSGSTMRYRAEWSAGQVRVTRLDQNTAVTVGEGTTGAAGAAIELRLAKTDVADLAAMTDLAVRVFAVEAGTGFAVQDRMQTIFLRSRFDLLAPASSTAWADLRFLEPPETADASLAPSYLAMGAVLVKDLESANAIPLYDRGTLPLFYVGKEESGYAGLNTTDRGMLTTLGPSTGQLTRAQLLAHELAHYQNARSSQVKSRWLQEGMSEWTAERLLYKHYPKRAVHWYLQRLRFDRYFDSLDGKLDKFPLDGWSSEVEPSGYEKSLMFFDLAESVVGQAALIKAFQLGVNETIDSAAFQRVLERETVKDLSALFKYWIFAGEAAADYDPYQVFKDQDGDELMGLDESAYGTNPQRIDTDGDGWTDAEEVFAGSDPLESSLDPSGTLIGTRTAKLATTATDTSALLRIGGDPAATRKYGFDPYGQGTGQDFGRPLFVRPPVSLAILTTLNGTPGLVETLTRPLFVKGVEVATPFPTTGILPSTPHKQKTIYSGGQAVTPASGSIPYPLIDDTAQDLPADVTAFDLIKFAAALDGDGALDLTLTANAAVDQISGFGEYRIALQSLVWSASGASVKTWNALSFVAGEPYWAVVDASGNETATLLTSGVSWTFGQTLKVHLGKTLAAAWLAAPGERRVCAQSSATLVGGTVVRDKAGCVVLPTNDYTLRRLTVPDTFGVGTHSVDLSVNTAEFSESRTSELLALSGAALREFEALLAHPLLDRRQWPVHLTLATGGATTAAAMAAYGAYVTIDKTTDPSIVDYLVVEQLARLVTADLLERLGDRAYWLQETFIQWLTSSALYRIYPTRTVHDFHLARIEDFRCFVDGVGACSAYFTGDLPLSQWNSATLGSTGSVRSLMATLELDALLGTQTMAKVFGLYMNAALDAAQFKQSLLALAPSQATAIASFWTSWVDGSGNQANDTAVARAQIADTDNDGLYLFEEMRLGFSEAVANNYLDP